MSSSPWQSRMLVTSESLKDFQRLLTAGKQESSPAMGDQEGIMMEWHNQSNKPTKCTYKKASKQPEQKANHPGNHRNKRHNIFSERDIPQVLGYPHLSMALEIGGIYTRAELESRCSGTSERKRQLVPWTENTFSLLSRLETVNANIRVSYRGCICVLLWMGPCLTIFDILYTIAYLDNDLINWALLCKNTLSRGANRSQLLTANWGSKFGSFL